MKIMKKQIESQNIEYKESWRDEYLKTLTAFANTEGGKLIIGIDDIGKVIGVKEPKRLLEYIPNKIKDILGVIPSVKLEKKNDQSILIVSIVYSPSAVSYHGKFYVRSGSTTLELTGNSLTRFIISKSDKHWDDYFEENATIKDIDTNTIKRFKEMAVKRILRIVDEKDTLTFERTASRDLSVMVTKDILKQVGKTGKGTEYILRRHKDDKDAIKVP